MIDFDVRLAFSFSELQSPDGSDGDASCEGPGVNSGSSPSRSRLLASGSFEKQQHKRMSTMEGGKRRGSTKRRMLKHRDAWVNSGDRDMREEVTCDDWTNLSSPFVVRGVQLSFSGSLPRSKRGLSLALWICLTKRASELEVGVVIPRSESRGLFLGRMSSQKRERVIHLCSIGSGKSLFEVWILPSDGFLLFRFVYLLNVKRKPRGNLTSLKRLLVLDSFKLNSA